MLPLCIDVLVSPGFFLVTDMSSIFWCSWRALELKFCVQNGFGTAQQYRKQLASADAPSPIAGGDHVWKSVRICVSAQHSHPKMATIAQQLYPRMLIMSLLKIWHFPKLFEKGKRYAGNGSATI